MIRIIIMEALQWSFIFLLEQNAVPQQQILSEYKYRFLSSKRKLGMDLMIVVHGKTHLIMALDHSLAPSVSSLSGSDCAIYKDNCNS